MTDEATTDETLQVDDDEVTDLALEGSEEGPSGGAGDFNADGIANVGYRRS